MYRSTQEIPNLVSIEDSGGAFGIVSQTSVLVDGKVDLVPE